MNVSVKRYGLAIKLKWKNKMPRMVLRLPPSQVDGLEDLVKGKNKLSKHIRLAMKKWCAEGRDHRDLEEFSPPFVPVGVSFAEGHAGLMSEKTGIPFAAICRSAIEFYLNEKMPRYGREKIDA